MTTLYNRISTEPPEVMIFIPNKRGKVFAGEWYTPKELDIEIVASTLEAIRKLRKQRMKGVAK